uniref:Reverse transcriptase zinc-binding domain-containing protein n=1 Tax=Manihot esculenta TaxID=3983 RepID=A0A2C9U9M3_MANES
MGRVFSKNSTGRKSLVVAELHADEGLQWDVGKLNLLFSEEEVEAILKIPCLRCCRGFLPVKERLRYQRVDIDEVCPACNQNIETIYHTLFDCVFAREAWLWSRLPVDFSLSSVHEWLNFAMMNWNKEQQQFGAVMMWELWRSTNDLVWSQKKLLPNAISLLAKRLLNDWNCAVVAMKMGGPGSPILYDSKWRKPDINQVKLNVDASF